MKFTLPRFVTLFGAALAAFVTPAPAAPGDLDVDFNPAAGGDVFSTAVQTDGKIVIGGAFNSVGGVTRNGMARVNADGTLDVTFNPNLNGDVFSIAVRADGRIIVGGEFTSVGGLTHRRLARLNSDGSPDETFNPNVGGSFPIVYSIALQTDGRMVIGGTFTSVNGTTRNRIARLNADGTLDTAFNPNANSQVRATLVQEDGKILAGGQFTVIASEDRNHIARFNADGTLDEDFNPGTDSHVSGMALQANGNIVFWGEFTKVGTLDRTYIARLNPSGAPDAAFNPVLNSLVRTAAVQANGEVIIGGSFTTIGTDVRNRIARLRIAGGLDATFNPNADGVVSSIALQADGAVLVGGAFSKMGGQSRSRFARLFNDEPEETLAVPALNRVEWLRDGGLPEVVQVSFELSTDAGKTWNLLGPGTRKEDGWELTGLTLPTAGEIRARARTAGGQYNGSSGWLEVVEPFGLPPEIAVEQPAGTSLVDGTASVGFKPILTGATDSREFTIKNTGLHVLTGLAVTFDGDHAADFTLTTAPDTTVAAGASTKFTVEFGPGSAGSKDAALHIASNDPDENPFDINLTGRALDPAADDDDDNMTNGAEVMLADCGFNPLEDSTALIAQLRANGILLASDVQTLALTQPVLEKNPATGHFHLGIGVEKSIDLTSWTLLPETVDYEIIPEDPVPQFYRVLGKKP